MGQTPDEPGLSLANRFGKEAIGDSCLTVTVMGRRKRRPEVEMGIKAVGVR